jgi:guanylate kinase
LKQRLINRRTETEEDLQKRFNRAKMEIDYQDHFEYIVVNDNLDEAKEKVFNILSTELKKEK